MTAPEVTAEPPDYERGYDHGFADGVRSVLTAHPPKEVTAEPVAEAEILDLTLDYRRASSPEEADRLFGAIESAVRKLAHPPVQPTEPVAWRLRKESGAWMYANTEAFLIINGCPPPEPLYAHPPAPSEQWIQEAMRLVDERTLIYAKLGDCLLHNDARAALEAHLRGKG